MADETSAPPKPTTPEQYAYQRDQYVSWADTQLERLHERHTLSGQEFDKQIVALAGGGLALTLTLAKDVFEAGGVQLAWLVYLSWACFLVALTVNLLSHRTAADHYNLMTERMGCLRWAAIKSQPVDRERVSELGGKIDKLTPHIKRMNNLALFSTLAGIGFFVIFIGYNHNYYHELRPERPNTTSVRSAAAIRAVTTGTGRDTTRKHTTN